MSDRRARARPPGNRSAELLALPLSLFLSSGPETLHASTLLFLPEARHPSTRNAARAPTLPWAAPAPACPSRPSARVNHPRASFEFARPTLFCLHGPCIIVSAYIPSHPTPCHPHPIPGLSFPTVCWHDLGEGRQLDSRSARTQAVYVADARGPRCCSSFFVQTAIQPQSHLFSLARSGRPHARRKNMSARKKAEGLVPRTALL